MTEDVTELRYRATAIRSRSSSFTEAEVREVKKLLRSGVSDAEIATRFGKNARQVRDIRIGYTWTYVP